MSEAIGETFVTITPIVDEASFKAQAEQQIERATSDLKATGTVTPVIDKAAFRADVQKDVDLATSGVKAKVGVDSIVPNVDEAAFKASAQQQINVATQGLKVTVPVVATVGAGDLAADIPKDPFESLRRERQRLFDETEAAFNKSQLVASKSLVGQASIDEAAASLGVYTQTALRAAKADVELSIATGVQTETSAASAAILKQEQLALLQNTAATEQNTLSTRENRQAHSQTFRGQIRNVTEGRADVGSLLGPAALLRFGAAGLAVGALFQGLQRAQEALKVTGDEAFTTEGKFRNLGAALLTGDVVGGFIALTANEKSAADQLKDLSKDAATTSVDLRNLGQEALEGAEKSDEAVAAWERLGTSGGAMGAAVRKARIELQEAADDALALARASDAAASAVHDVETAIARAGSEAAVFGERTGDFGRGPGAAARESAQPTTGVKSDVDESNTEANRAAIARSRAERTKSLQDDLVEAKKEAEAAAKLEKNQADIPEGRTDRRRAVVEARTRIVRIEQQIQAEEDRVRKEAVAEAKRRQTDAAAALRDRLALREGSLQIALDEARATEGTVADDRKALLALIAFEKEKQNNRALTLQERQNALAAERGYRRDLGDLNKQALADALGMRRQNLENAILAAKLTDDGDKDDDRANAKKLKFLQNQVKRAKGDARAVAQAKNELLAFRLSLKDQASGGGGFTIEELFGEAQKQFQEFGSNVSAGVSTGGSVRGAFAGGIAAQNPRVTPGEQQQLSVAGETNLLLGRILDAISRGQSRPSATRAAAVWEGGGPAGLERAWTTKQLTGKTG